MISTAGAARPDVGGQMQRAALAIPGSKVLGVLLALAPGDGDVAPVPFTPFGAACLVAFHLQRG